MKNTLRKPAILILLTAGVAVAAVAQNKEHKEEHKPTNLTVLPKNISHDSLFNVMKEYSYSLGVRCGFCHAKTDDGKHLDFASDNNRHKKVARYMMQMTASINEKYFAEENQNSSRTMVSCYTCHKGHEEPEVFVMPKEEERH